MIVTIVAGGSGTRLWPLSIPSYPKHLLSVGSDSQSLLKKTYDRAKKLTDTVYVVTEKGHAHFVREQLPDLTDDFLIIEPARRGTANCLLASLTQISRMHPHDEPMLTIPADHYVRDTASFIESMHNAVDIFEEQKRLVMIGVEPDYPSTGFGYIQKGSTLPNQPFAFEVQAFKEKPDHETAKHYVSTGNFLWSCSYFVGSVQVYRRTMRLVAPEMASRFEQLRELRGAEYDALYLSLPVNSGEKELIEKTTDTIVVQGNFDWKDLGTYDDLYRAADLDKDDNHILGNVETEQVQGSFIQNHDTKPLSVIGLNNIVVVNNRNGILVARKDMSQQIGDVSKRITDKPGSSRE